MTLKMNSFLLSCCYVIAVTMVTLASLATGQQGTFNLRESPGPSRQVEVFVNVYDHPKTGFSCVGKAPGQYYADPATKCAVYYVCIPNPTGNMSPQSFACPNGTIFSQATRVCRPHEEVYCNLATRYYDNTQGKIDEKAAFEPLPLPVPVPDVPAVPATSFASGHHHSTSGSRRHHQQQSGAVQKRAPQTSAAPAPKAAAPVAPAPPQNGGNLFNGNTNNGRFRNSRTNSFASSQPSTTSTTTPPAHKPPPAGPGALPGTGLSDYEYDYGDYTNETDSGRASGGGLSHAASSLHAAIIENIAEAIAKESKELAAASAADDSTQKAKTTESKAASSTRRKRSSESADEKLTTPSLSSSWSLLNRRKGQLAEEKSLLSSFGERMLLEREEEEVDALAKDLLAQTAAANVVLAGAEVLPTTILTTSALSSFASTAFTCEDKVSGVAYADIDSGCSKFYICVTVAKGKQWSYHLACDQGLTFSQVLGTCEANLPETECARSEQYYLFAKSHRPSKKHLLAEKKKRQMKKMAQKKDFE